MALDRPIAEYGRPEHGRSDRAGSDQASSDQASSNRAGPHRDRRARAALPSAAELASLGTVLCVYRSRYGGELGGWAQAVGAESWCGIDSDGWHECLQFRDRNGHCCWRLYLLPDSDFFAWEQLTARLPRAEAMPSPGDGIASRLWRRVASRVGGEHWLASVLRLHTMPPAQPAPIPVLAASLAPVSMFGADVVRRIARIEGIDSALPLDDCCCRQFAVTAPSRAERSGHCDGAHSAHSNGAHSSGMSSSGMPSKGMSSRDMRHDALLPLIRFQTRTSE